MRFDYPRTSLAAVLTVAAVALPCAAWFLAGQGQLEHEGELRERAIYSSAMKKGVVLAERLATRFELLREAESRRPFYQYQNLFHDPEGVAEGMAINISPLATGPSDPLIDAYFQVDAEGGLSLPTLNDEFPELGAEGAAANQCELLWKLSDVAVFCNLESGEPLPIGSRWHSNLEDLAAGVELPQDRIVTLSAAAWRQHLRANALYADLKYERDHPQAAVDFAPGVEGAKVEVRVSPLRWHTLPVGGEPGLVALRTVDTPAGVWTQGFAVDLHSVAQAVETPAYEVSFEPYRPEESCGSGEVLAPVEGTPWQIRLGLEEVLAEADTDLAATRSGFLRLFLFATAGAGLAGVLVVMMVWYSERLARQRSQFAAAAAHELRTPLAGLRLYGEMLAEGLGEPGRAASYARRMASEAERLGRVVTNVLSFARLERGSLSLSAEEGRLQEAVLEAYQRQRMALEESGAKVELELDDDLPPIAFDRDAVAHIVQNLLDNAEKYTRDIDDRRIVLSLEQEAKNVVLSVADNGRGISKSLQRRLFRPFSRGVDSDSPEGLGLGLVLVRMLARAQGADISYQDGPRGGAVFKVAFPVERPA